MDNLPAVTSRQSIEGLELKNEELSQKILGKFEMFREIPSNMMRVGVNFAYLEHLFRISTPIEVCRSGVAGLPSSLRGKLTHLVQNRHDILQEALHSLDSLLDRNDIMQIEPRIMNINHKWNGSRLIIEEFPYGEGENLPICYSLFYNKSFYMLYTPNMNYIDGYEPFSGETKIPLLPEGIIKNVSKEFYMRVNTKSVQTDGAKARKLKDTPTPAKSTPVPTQGDLTNRDSERNVTITGFNRIEVEMREKSEEAKLQEYLNEEGKNSEKSEHAEVEEEEEEEEVEEDEEDEEPEDSESVNYDEIPQRKLPGERTWERFQKRAAEKQKERDQCGPGDCILC